MLWEEFKLPIWVTEFDWNANNDVGEQLSIWAETLEKLRSLVLQTWVSILSTQNRSTTSTHWCSVLRYRLNLKDAYKRSGFPRTSNFFCSFRLGSARYTYVEHEHCGRVDNRAKQGWPRIPATYQVIHARLTHCTSNLKSGTSGIPVNWCHLTLTKTRPPSTSGASWEFTGSSFWSMEKNLGLDWKWNWRKTKTSAVISRVALKTKFVLGCNLLYKITSCKIGITKLRTALYVFSSTIPEMKVVSTFDLVALQIKRSSEYFAWFNGSMLIKDRKTEQ